MKCHSQHIPGLYSVILAAFMLALAFQPAVAQQDEPVAIPEDIELISPEEIQSRQPMDIPAVSGVIIRDLSSGEDILEINPDMWLVPASVMKSVTAAANLIDGRSDRRFTTEAFTQGAVSGGVLYGNLIVKASGDPTTDSNHFIGNHGLADSIAARVRMLGVDTIRGQIVFDTSAVPGDGPSPYWQPEDLKYSYGAGHYAINYRDNTVGGNRAMPDPPGSFFDALDSALSRRNVIVLDENVSPLPRERKLYSQESPTAKEIMHDMMVRSDNMFAEGMLRSLAPGKEVSYAVAREKQLLARLGADTVGLRIFDGSGLARANRLSARFLADMLQRMARSRWSRDYTDLFPRAGVNGTVRKVLADTPLAGKVILKSGSMRGIQCWAGYKLDDKGIPTHAIVFLMNDIKCDRALVKKEAERVMLKAFIPDYDGSDN